MAVNTGSFNRSFQDVVTDILSQLTGSTVKVSLEPHLFFLGLEHYPLIHPNATEVLEITGVTSGSQITFVQSVDYQLTAQNEIDFGLTGSIPDNDTVFYSTYRYHLPYTSVLTDVNIGSISRTIVEAISAEIGILSGSEGGLYRLLKEIYYSGFITFASGSSLDFLAALLGVVRKAPTNAVGEVTFSRELSGSIITIPKGTIIETRSTIQELPITFATSDDATLQVTGSVTVGAEALVPGRLGNVGVSKITIFDTPIDQVDNVTNDKPFTGGADAESDVGLRLRSLAQLETLARATTNSLRFAILANSGVDSVVVKDLARGPGTADVIVLTNVIPIPYRLRKTILDTIDEFKAAGVDVDLLEPLIKNINVICDIQLRSDPGVNQSSVKRQAVQNISDYVNGLTLGETVVYNKLIDAIITVYGIADVSLKSPGANVHINITEVARLGLININFV